MNRDIRDSALYQEAQALYGELRQPGAGQISDAAEIHASPDGRHAVFAGTMVDSLDAWPRTRICRVDLESGEMHVLTCGPGTDRSPKYASDGRQIAFLSDRHDAGDFQLFLMDAATAAVHRAPAVDGWVEYIHWSPSGKRLLLGVAGHGADVMGGQGAVTTSRRTEALPSWVPTIEIGDEAFRWRRVWVYDVATGQVYPVSPSKLNVWEAVWCGEEMLAFVGSAGPGEGLWYGARLYACRLEADDAREVCATPEQMGWPAASPDGKYLAIVEGLGSDRGLIAGNLRIIDMASGQSQRIDTHGVDVSCTEWCSNAQLLLAGHRGLSTVIGVYDVPTATFSEQWTASELTSVGYHATVAGCGGAGACVLVAESFARAPEIGIVQHGAYRTVKSLAVGKLRSNPIRDIQAVRWQAPDGLDIEGWLLLPHATGALPLVMNVHGGPVWHWRPFWLGRRAAPALMLLQRGYALFYPNPRGSTGRGQGFARRVCGDMGGADTFDYLSGLDFLVARGIADPKRLGVSGVSYGGFMTSWLITQDARFAAAVSVAPVINHVTEHLISNIPHFVSKFLEDTYTNCSGKYFERSPVMHAYKVTTPTLNICGALDRCTPPEEAVQFHRALLENGVKSVLVSYPEEGHGVRKFPALLDYAARMVGWFAEHMPAQ